MGTAGRGGKLGDRSVLLLPFGGRLVLEGKTGIRIEPNCQHAELPTSLLLTRAGHGERERAASSIRNRLAQQAGTKRRLERRRKREKEENGWGERKGRKVFLERNGKQKWREQH